MSAHLEEILYHAMNRREALPFHRLGVDYCSKGNGPRTKSGLEWHRSPRRLKFLSKSLVART